MTVQLRDDNLADLDSLMEGLSLLEASLADGAVHDENGRVRLDGSLDLQHLVEE